MKQLERILAVTASCGVALITAATTGVVAGHADTGWSHFCSADSAIVVPMQPVLPNVTLAVGIGGPGQALTPTVALCFATSGDGQPGSGELAGGAIGVTVDNSQVPSAPDQVACYYSDSDAQIQPTCGAIVNPTATWTPATAPALGGTLSVSVPFVVCAGVNVVVGYTCAFPTVPPTLAATGLIVSNVVIQGGPSCCPVGATVSPTTALYLNGVLLETTADAGAGVNPSAIGAGTKPTTTNLFCLGPNQCVPLPSAFVSTSTAPVADLLIAGSEVPIALPSQVPQCITVGAPSGAC